jgi:hypothetical protein
MALRIRTQRFAMFAASTAVVAGGVLLPTSAFAAPATSSHVSTVTTVTATQDGQDPNGVADPAENWVEITDEPTGITFRLPAEPTVEDISERGADGETYTGRSYSVETSDGSAAIAFNVYDVRGAQVDLDLAIEEVCKKYEDLSDATATSAVEETTVDGHPAREARLSSQTDVGSASVAADGAHLVGFMSLGPVGEEAAMAELHQQVSDSVSIPSSEESDSGSDSGSSNSGSSNPKESI